VQTALTTALRPEAAALASTNPTATTGPTNTTNGVVIVTDDSEADGELAAALAAEQQQLVAAEEEAAAAAVASSSGSSAQLSCEAIAQSRGRSELVMHLCAQRARDVKAKSRAAFHLLQRKLIVAELHKTELRYLKGLLTLERIYLPVLVTGSADKPVDLMTHDFDMRVSVISPAQARLIFSHIFRCAWVCACVLHLRVCVVVACVSVWWLRVFVCDLRVCVCLAYVWRVCVCVCVRSRACVCLCAWECCDGGEGRNGGGGVGA
jgi:hypothetical protein